MAWPTLLDCRLRELRRNHCATAGQAQTRTYPGQRSSTGSCVPYRFRLDTGPCVLPLALDQAGAYIEETGGGLLKYLNLYQTHATELLRRRGTLASDHPDPVAATWALSFEKIEQANPAAAELLRFCAFLRRDQIPEEVFSKGAPELGPVLERVGADAFVLDGAIVELLKYSLVRRDPNASTLEIHRLVQAVLKGGMDEATQRLWAERAVCGL
jgi:hypothetical protein